MKNIIPIAFTEEQEKLLRQESERIGEISANIVRKAVVNYFLRRDR